jgi:predicted metalloprotease with PDZ domain
MENMMKGLFGSDKNKIPKSGGHTLGGADSEAAAKKSVEITFASQSLGLTLTKQKEGGGVVVTGVAGNSESRRAGVRKGFKVVGFEGGPVTSYEDLMSSIKGFGRPCRINFEIPPGAAVPQINRPLTPAEQEARRKQVRKTTDLCMAFARASNSHHVAGNRSSRIEKSGLGQEDKESAANKQ